MTPQAVRRSNNGNNSGLALSPTITANTTGNCTGLYVKYQAVAGTYRTQTLMAAASVYSVVLDDTAWDVGVHTLDLYDAANTKRGSILLTVCLHNAVVC